MQHDYKIALDIIKEAGKIITRNIRFSREINKKSFANFVTDLDLKVEKYMVEQLLELFPNYSVMTEETYNTSHKNEEYVWILDPIDGTTNLIHKYPLVVISLSLLYKNEIIFGSIYNPLYKELFYAEKKGGAYLNNKRIIVSQNKTLETSIVGFGLPYDRKKSNIIFDKTQAIFNQSQDVKRAGPAALDIAYVACGRLDAYYEMDLQPWDYSAGIIIIEESGGKVTQWSGNKVVPFKPNNILATNGYIHDDIIQVLRT